MDGHNSTVGGAAIAASQEHLEAIQFCRNCLGSNMSPQVAFYTMQGTKTMSTRLEAQSANAMKVAEFLQTQHGCRRPLPGLAIISAIRTRVNKRAALVR